MCVVHAVVVVAVAVAVAAEEEEEDVWTALVTDGTTDQ